MELYYGSFLHYVEFFKGNQGPWLEKFPQKKF